MFQRFCRKQEQKPTEKVVENKSRPCSTSCGSVTAPAAPTTPWWKRLYGTIVNIVGYSKKTLDDEAGLHSSPQESEVPPSQHPATAAAGKSGKKKSKRRCSIFHCCKRKRRVTPVTDEDGERKTPHKKRPIRATQETAYAPDEDTEEVKSPTDAEHKEAKGETKKVELPEVQTQAKRDSSSNGSRAAPNNAEKKDELPEVQAVIQTPVKQDSLKRLKKSSDSTETPAVAFSDVTQVSSSQLPTAQQDWLGFPNPAQICYMNSSLQSLITLADFIKDVNMQEEVWRSVPEAELIRRFMNVVWCHHSTDTDHKLKALDKFKRVLSLQAPEFQDHCQKDAHEFLTSVLDQIRNLSPLLQDVAASVGRTYRCPIQDHLVFQMQNTRTCKSCGAGSIRNEDFTNLSLSLLPGASVQEMLQDYLMETELEFRCDCGANTSGQQSAFITLPRVLMLHVKRFCFTPSLQLKKLCDPVRLFRELMVTSSQADGWYSLVSIISHLGSGVNSGHYISDGINPDAEMDDPADRWLTYNDSEVKHKTGASVYEQRQRTAYILFYQRRM